ncbi:MAG: acylphosphatase [Pseudomonadota bacterium]
MEEKFGMHCLVTGLVQGVWFRAGTHDTANKLGLSGWVRNLPDGRVEVMAFGSKEAVLELYEWLKKGPPRAKVEDLTFEEMSWQEHQGFTIT